MHSIGTPYLGTLNGLGLYKALRGPFARRCLTADDDDLLMGEASLTASVPESAEDPREVLLDLGSRRRLTASFRLLQVRGKDVSELSTACSSSIFSWWSPCTREAQGPSFTTKEAYLSALSPSCSGTCVSRCRPFSQLHASIVPSALGQLQVPSISFCCLLMFPWPLLHLLLLRV